MSGTSLNAINFLIKTIFDFYIIILFLRLGLAWMHANYHDALTRLVDQLTYFIVRPLKRFIPDVKGFEMATLVLIILVEVIKYFIITLFSYGFPNLLGLLILAIGDTLQMLLETLSFMLLIQFLLYLLQPQSTFYTTLYQFTFPITKPIKKIIPPIAGKDISPIIAIIILQLLVIIVANQIKFFGLGITVSS